MIVISDTTPLNYLIQIEHTFVLRELYSRVIISQAVKEELRSDAAPVAVKTWIKTQLAFLPEGYQTIITNSTGSLRAKQS